MAADQTDFPMTVDAAVRVLRGMLPIGEQEMISSLREDELVTLHLGLGQ
jgi:hypothetical protein